MADFRMVQDCHQPVVELHDVSFQYENKSVVNQLTFQLLERDFVCLAGTNGAGKTTVLRMIVGLLKPTSGDIRLFGESIHQFKDWHRIGYVPQKNALNPLFPATVSEVVESGMYGRNTMFRRVAKIDRRRVSDALEVMAVGDLANQRIGQLSGGQQQRVFLARALVNNPSLLILDEPTVGIDAETQQNFFQMIRHMHEHHPMTFLIVTHDMSSIESYVSHTPQLTSGGLKLFVKHTHAPEDCNETGLSHSLSDLRVPVSN